MSSDRISATITYLVWREEHLLNVSVLQRVHLSNRVILFSYLRAGIFYAVFFLYILFCQNIRDNKIFYSLSKQPVTFTTTDYNIILSRHY
jgi:hypothetical protein